jgi:4-hydroxy-tetrahydrodipicolinate synthase
MHIHGSVCALVTPFGSDGALDMAAFGRLLDFQIAGGTQAVVVAGSTGEAHMLEHDEYERLLAFAVERVAGRIPVIAGTGDAGTAKTVALTKRACELGANAALVVAPYYVRPTQEGLRRHFLEVAEQGGLPVLLYNVPSRTGCDLLPETTALLREHPSIIGIKEARGDAERIRQTAELVRPDFVYLSGDDGSAGEAMLAGAAGTVSVVVNLVPKAFRALCDAATVGDRAATTHWHATLDPLVQALNCAPNPIAVKAGLPDLGLGTATPRLPLVELEQGPAREQLRKALATLASLADAA